MRHLPGVAFLSSLTKREHMWEQDKQQTRKMKNIKQSINNKKRAEFFVCQLGNKETND